MYLPTRLRLGRAPLGLLQIIHVDSRGRLIPVPITDKLFILSTIIVLVVLTPTRPRSLATMHGVHVTAVQEVTGCFARGIYSVWSSSCRVNTTLLLCIIYITENVARHHTRNAALTTVRILRNLRRDVIATNTLVGRQSPMDYGLDRINCL